MSKQYRIQGPRAAYGSLRESLAGAGRRAWLRLRALAGRDAHADPWLRSSGRGAPFWALREVSFEVQPGEILGIVGRNGAGKSTLLKILARVTHPTSGHAELHGHTGSLLEVGTGFHPELTGRENIYLNGAILGMSRAEVRRQFDAIAAFAEIENFLDVPVKRYSSGMYTRLAFAVAAHLDTEILLVDEVLAVGDVRFTRRCLSRLGDLQSSGRTILFVSHNMPAVLRLCHRALLLEAGRIVADGPPAAVARRYLGDGERAGAERVWPAPDAAPGDELVRLHAVRALDTDGRVCATLDIRRPLRVEVQYWDLQGGRQPSVSLQFVNEDGVTLLCSNDFSNHAWWNAERGPGLVCAQCTIPGNFFAEGRIFLQAAVCSYNPSVLHVVERDVISWQVVDPAEGDSVRGPYDGAWPGVLRPQLDWSVALTAEQTSEEPAENLR